jgi:hypothetical protein
MAGFPIHLNGEVRGTPLVCDIDHDRPDEILLRAGTRTCTCGTTPARSHPYGVAAWPMWRHDQYRPGPARWTAPRRDELRRVLGARRQTAGLVAQPSCCRWRSRPTASYDVYRAQGPGTTASCASRAAAGLRAHQHASRWARRRAHLLLTRDVVGAAGHDVPLPAGASVRSAGRDVPRLRSVRRHRPRSEAPEVAFGDPELPEPGERTAARRSPYGVPSSAADGGAHDVALLRRARPPGPLRWSTRRSRRASTR